MQKPWLADFEVSADLATTLIREQCGGLPCDTIRHLGTGWDNIAYVVDESWVFRFPRRAIAAPAIDHELTFLPVLAPLLPLPIPAPIHRGQSSGAYPYPFAGYAHLAGETACGPPVAGDIEANAQALAGFLRALHDAPVGPIDGRQPPTDDFGRGDLPKRIARIAERVGQLDRSQVLPAPERILATARDLMTAPAFNGARGWVHGDLYPRHLLVDADHALCGVIDFGDLHINDPGIDLAAVWLWLPATVHAAFFDVYGAIDDDTWARARFRAIDYGVTLHVYGRDIGDRRLQQTGTIALNQIV